MNRLFILLTMLLAGSFSLSGQLFLNIDTANRQFFFTGSTSGTPVNDLFLGYTARFGFNTSVDFDHPFDSEHLLGIADRPFDEYSIGSTLVVFGDQDSDPASDLGWMTLELTSNSAFSTVTGSAIRYSYAGLNEWNLAFLESMIGQSLGLNTGTGFGSVSIMAIPEPSMVALGMGMAGLGAVFLFRYRRRSKVKAAA